MALPHRTQRHGRRDGTRSLKLRPRGRQARTPPSLPRGRPEPRISCRTLKKPALSTNPRRKLSTSTAGKVQAATLTQAVSPFHQVTHLVLRRPPRSAFTRCAKVSPGRGQQTEPPACGPPAHLARALRNPNPQMAPCRHLVLLRKPGRVAREVPSPRNPAAQRRAWLIPSAVRVPSAVLHSGSRSERWRALPLILRRLPSRSRSSKCLKAPRIRHPFKRRRKANPKRG